MRNDKIHHDRWQEAQSKGWNQVEVDCADPAMAPYEKHKTVTL